MINQYREDSTINPKATPVLSLLNNYHPDWETWGQVQDHRVDLMWNFCKPKPQVQKGIKQTKSGFLWLSDSTTPKPLVGDNGYNDGGYLISLSFRLCAHSYINGHFTHHITLWFMTPLSSAYSNQRAYQMTMIKSKFKKKIKSKEHIIILEINVSVNYFTAQCAHGAAA